MSMGNLYIASSSFSFSFFFFFLNLYNGVSLSINHIGNFNILITNHIEKLCRTLCNTHIKLYSVSTMYKT